VIPYDNKDVGRFAVYEAGHPSYDRVDLVDDAAGVRLP
jgi:hypothetical protein